MSEQTIWDVIIVGGGPAGLAAAIYTAREKLSTLVVEAGVTGGMMALTANVDNYPGYPLGSTGFEIAKNMTDQAKACGAQLKYGRVESLQAVDGLYQLMVDGQMLVARTVLLATGTTNRKLGLEREDSLIGQGVHYCATCDGAFYQDKIVAVIGGGNSAVEEALFLTRFASKIHLLVRNQLTATPVLQQALRVAIEAGKIELHLETSVKQIKMTDGVFAGLEIDQAGQSHDLVVDGMFVFIGLVPKTEFLSGQAAVDDQGFIKINTQHQTNLPGVFAAGDIVSGSLKQIAIAVGDGVQAALAISHYLR